MKAKLRNEIVNELRLEGVNSQGFGIICRFVICDRGLHIIAKAIYLYFCSLAGNKSESYPSVSRILHDLRMSESTYYRYYKQLVINGYISVKQEIGPNGTFSKNIITIIANPPRYQEEASNYPPSNAGLVRSQGMKSLGYGIIPRAIMFDIRLSAKAKVIYAYFCTYANAGASAYPQRKTILYHLNIGKDAYYENYRALIELNYITVVQRFVNGRLSVNDYYINEFPDPNNVQIKNTTGNNDKNTDEEPCLDFEGTAQSKSDSEEKPCLDFDCTAENLDFTGKSLRLDFDCTVEPCPDFASTVIQRTANQGTNNTSVNKTNINKKKSNNPTVNNSIHQSIKKQYGSAKVIHIDNNSETEKMDGWIDPKNASYKSVSTQANYGEITIQDKRAIIDEIIRYGELPVVYRNDPQKLITAIELITEKDCYDEKNAYNEFHLCVQSLIDLCLMKNSITLKGSYVNYGKVFEVINRNLTIYEDCNCATIHEVIYAASSDFKEAMKTTTIKDPAIYMKACLWNSLNTSRLG